MARLLAYKLAIQGLVKDIATPSSESERAYTGTIIGIGHVMLGAAFAGFGFLFAAFYWFVKERHDLRRKGSILDGLIDAALVAFGTLYQGPWWWPALALVISGMLSIHQDASYRLRRFSIEQNTSKVGSFGQEG